MPGIIGWDIGGAHLKAARLENGMIVDVVQIACPLWLGLDHLHKAFEEAKARLGSAKINVATMTGELSDAFADRTSGVLAISAAAVNALGPTQIYAGPAGFAAANTAAKHVALIASANWHASATLVAKHLGEALFVDMGSTTTDIIPLKESQVAAQGYSDATRMAYGELVYAGIVRSFLMAGLRLVPFGGRWGADHERGIHHDERCLSHSRRSPGGCRSHADGRRAAENDRSLTGASRAAHRP